MQIKVALLAARHWKKLVMAVAILFMVVFMFFFSLQQEEQQGGNFSGDGTGGQAKVTALVLRYEPLVAQYAAKYGVGQYTQLLLAKIMQESGGRLPDVMQSSESIGLPRNAIQDPERSIDVGVKYFAGVMKKAGGDVKLALQSYNFGMGFIDYAKARGGYSKEVAQQFSNMMAAKMGWSRYGDINYVDNVLRYYTNGQFNAGTVSAMGNNAVNAKGLIRPLNTKITSPFGMRIHPLTGIATMHKGVDFSCNRQNIPIYIVKNGTVTKAGWENPANHGQGYGQRVYVDHGGGFVTVYAHLQRIDVKVGQKVSQNQSVGLCGATGGSKGIHLHFETQVNGARLNPMNYLGG